MSSFLPPLAFLSNSICFLYTDVSIIHFRAELFLTLHRTIPRSGDMLFRPPLASESHKTSLMCPDTEFDYRTFQLRKREACNSHSTNAGDKNAWSLTTMPNWSRSKIKSPKFYGWHTKNKFLQIPFVSQSLIWKISRSSPISKHHLPEDIRSEKIKLFNPSPVPLRFLQNLGNCILRFLIGF
jgi:hypothetical protein